MSGIGKSESTGVGAAVHGVVKYVPGYQMTKLGAEIVQKHTVLPKILDKLKNFEVGAAAEVLGNNGIKNMQNIFNFVKKSVGL